MLDKLSVAGETEQFKQSVHFADALRESIVANVEIMTAECSGQISSVIKIEQVPMVQQLQNALSTLQVLVLDHASELTPAVGDQALQRVAEVATQLYQDLAAVMDVAQIEELQTDAKLETDLEIFKESITNDKSNINAGKAEQTTLVHETIAFETEVELEEQATEIAVEPVALLVTKSESITVFEVESHLNNITKLEDDVKGPARTDDEFKAPTPVTGNLILSYSFIFNHLHIVDLAKFEWQYVIKI